MFYSLYFVTFFFWPHRERVHDNRGAGGDYDDDGNDDDDNGRQILGCALRGGFQLLSRTYLS